jgi:hypothetical protein
MASYIQVQYASGLARALKEKRGRYCDLIRPVAPYLALCGNIVNPRDRKVAVPFFEWAADNFEVVWWVPGRVEVASASGVTENIKEMYDFVNTTLNYNVHIANKLSKVYSTGSASFRMIGISQPSVIDDNITGVFHADGKPYTRDDLREIHQRDHSWIEKELAIHNLTNNHIRSIYKQPALILTAGYVQTDIPYSANICGDIRANISGINEQRGKKAWYGTNNWEAPGYLPDKYVEMS